MVFFHGSNCSDGKPVITCNLNHKVANIRNRLLSPRKNKHFFFLVISTSVKTNTNDKAYKPSPWYKLI